MTNISTDEFKHGVLTESPFRGSSSRFIANLIVDDIEANPPTGRAIRRRINGRIIIDTTVPDGAGDQYEPPSCLVTGAPSVNNLATYRWQNGALDAETEIKLIQRIQNGDGRAFRQLLEAFHKTVIGPAGKYVPKERVSKRQPKGQKHTNDLLYEDFTSVGCVALWQSALKFDVSGNYRFSTLSRHRVIGGIKNEANYLRQRGFTSGDTVGRYLSKEVGRRTQSRLDRWIFDNLEAPPQELLEAQKRLVKRPIYHSLEEAADAIKRANNLQHPDIYSESGDDDVERDSYDTSKANRATEPLEEYRDVYQSQNPLYWSPQLVPHRNIVSPIVDFWAHEFCEPPRIKAKPNPKPIYPPCKVKPTGRVLKPIDAPYWMKPREKQKELIGKPYDPDRREAATVRLKSGRTKRQYRQMRADPGRSDAEWWSEHLGHPYRKSYVKYKQENEAKKWSYRDVRTESNKANGRASANVIVLESRRSRPQRFHVCQQCNPPRIGERFACEGVAR